MGTFGQNAPILGHGLEQTSPLILHFNVLSSIHFGIFCVPQHTQYGSN